MNKSKGFLQLMRPANIITSISDVLAGIAISGFLVHSDISSPFITKIVLLSISTIGLYGGGVVFNDVFDTTLDKAERPERPIPKGIISIMEATSLGILLLLTGIIAAVFVSVVSGILALSIAAAALIYNKWSKHNAFIGPLNMGLCRGLNLLLGISIIVSSVPEWWFLSFIPVIYIAGITMISRGEVHGGSKSALYLAAFLYCIVIASILFFAFSKATLWLTALFLLPFALMIFAALIKAIRNPAPGNIGKAVKAGVIALILMNAAWSAAFGDIGLAVIIILLLPLSLWLAKIFSVT